MVALCRWWRRWRGSLSAVCTLLALAGPAAADALVARQLSRADIWTSPSQRWEPPVDLASSDDAVLAPTTPWQPITLPHAHPRMLAGSTAQAQAPPEVRWYRLHLPATALVPSPQGPRLYLPRWQTVGSFAVYAQGRLLWQSRGSRVWNSFNQPVWIDLDGTVPPAGGLTLHLRMASQPGAGGAVSAAWVGPAEALLGDWRWRRWLQADFLLATRVAYLVLGLAALGIWLLSRRRGKETMYLLFFALAVCHLLASMLFLVDQESTGVADGWFHWLQLAGMQGSAQCTFHVLRWLHGWRLRRLGIAMGLYAAAVLAATLPGLDLVRPETLQPLLRAAIIPPATVVLGLALTGAWRRRTWMNVLLALWLLLAYPIGLHDLALLNYRTDIAGIYLTPYVYLGMFTLLAVLVAGRYRSALRLAARAKATLEQRLAAREQELALSHAQLRASERKQTLLQERERLMQDIHDGMGASLIGALRLTEQRGAADAALAQTLRGCIEDLRIAVDSLRPAEDDLLPLLAGLRHRMAPRLQAAGLALHWQVDELPPLPWLDPHSALHVLRLLQELFANILQHSGAQELVLCAAAADHGGRPGVRVTVRDDGRGFTPPAPDAQTTPGHGLANMRARARTLQAHMAWSSAVPRGTVFTLWLPCTRA